MLITSLELNNFKSYGHAKIRFEPGTIAIIGVNGAGKSSLLEAIGLALFGYQPEGTTLAGLIKEGESSASIIVEFVSSFDERAYEVERHWSSKGATRYRVFDSELMQVLAEGAEEVRNWLREHLCVTPGTDLGTLFANTIGVPQGTFTAPFLLSAAQRKLVFDPLLQVDEYRKASDNLRETVRHLEDQIVQLDQELARLGERLNDLPGLESERTVLQDDCTVLEARTGVLNHELVQVLEALDKLEQAEDRVQEATNRLNRVQDQLAGQQHLMQNAQQELEAAEQAWQQVEAARPGHMAYEEAERRLQTLETQRTERDRGLRERARLEQEQARVSERLERLAQELAELDEAAQRLQALAPQVAEQDALEAALRDAEADAQRLALARRRAQEAAQEEARAQAQVEACQSGLAEAAALREAVNQAQNALEALRERVREIQEQRAADRAESERLQKQSAILQAAETARCPTCETELTPAHRAELLERNAQRLRELKSILEAEQQQLEAYTDEGKATKEQIAQAQQRLQALPTEGALAQARQTLARCVDLRIQAEDEVQQLAEAPARIADLRAKLQALGDPRRAAQRDEDRLKQRSAREAERRQEQGRLGELVAQLAQVDQALAPYAGLDELIRAAREERARTQEDHRIFLSLSHSAAQREARRAQVQELADLLRTLEEQQRELARAQTEALAAYDAVRHAETRRQAEILRETLATCRAQLEEKQQRLAEVQQKLAHLESVQAELAQKRQAHAEAVRFQRLTETIRTLLRQAGPYVTQQLVQQISREASTLYGDIIGDHSGRLIWSDDYELMLEVKGRRRTFRQFSGGEQMSAALALRLALLRKTSAIDVAFFDEPTAHLDPERRDGLADKIMQVKGFAQVFVISHDDTFERAAQSYVHIVKDEDGSRWTEG